MKGYFKKCYQHEMHRNRKTQLVQLETFCHICDGKWNIVK